MNACIHHIIAEMEEIAPSSLAEPWDHVGLQVGEGNWAVRKIWVALDPTDTLLEDASRDRVDLIVCHHPLIFEPLHCVDPSEMVGRVVDIALRHQIGIFAAHTNLDNAAGGVNDVLSERLGLQNPQVLSPSQCNQFKLITYIPYGHEAEVADALFEAGAGKREKYSNVSFRNEGTGTFRALRGAKPFIGKAGEITQAREFRIEVWVEQRKIGAVLKALHRVHPYEDVAYDLFATQIETNRVGLGRIGTLDETLSLKELVRYVKENLDTKIAKVVGAPDTQIKKIAVCGGSGRGLVETFLRSDAQVFITGDLGYHDGRKIEFYKRACIDIGHFNSEHVIVKRLASRLADSLARRGHCVEVAAYEKETCCFRYD